MSRYLKLEPSNIYVYHYHHYYYYHYYFYYNYLFSKSVEAFNGITASTSFNYYYLSIAILPSL